MSQTTDIMNCDDYKIALAAEPDFNDESGHANNCADCQLYRSEMLALDKSIAAAMQINVPELVMPELPDIDNENVVALSSRRTPSAPVWFAIAASVALAVFIGVLRDDPQLPAVSLADQVLAHLDHEPLSLVPTNVAIDDDKLETVVPQNIASMNHNSGLITYAETCPVNGKQVPHLVIQGKRGPITIILMPDEEISANETLSGDNVFGYLLQVGSGSIAIIGERDEELEEVKQNLLNSVAWDI
jgi:hypothetical protein